LPPQIGGGPVLPSPKYLVAIVATSSDGGLKVIGYTVVDPSLSVGLPLPGGPPGHISGQPLPPGHVSGQPIPQPNPPHVGGGPAPTPEPKR
jgi:hypothetical protein